MFLKNSSINKNPEYCYFLFYVSKGGRIRNRYNQVPHLTQNTNGKATHSQLDTTNVNQEVSHFPSEDHKVQINDAHKHKTEKINDQQKKYRLGTVSKIILLEGLNRFHSANLTLYSDVDQDTQIFGLHERPLTNQCIISKNI